MKLYKYRMVSEAYIEAESMEDAARIAEETAGDTHDHCLQMMGFDLTEDDASSLHKGNVQQVISEIANRLMITTETQAQYLQRLLKEEAI